MKWRIAWWKETELFRILVWNNLQYICIISWLLEFILLSEVACNRGNRTIKIRLVKQKNTRGVNDVLFRTTGNIIYTRVLHFFLFLGASVVFNIMFLFLQNWYTETTVEHKFIVPLYHLILQFDLRYYLPHQLKWLFLAITYTYFDDAFWNFMLWEKLECSLVCCF
jgi:hypothetical protein